MNVFYSGRVYAMSFVTSEFERCSTVIMDIESILHSTIWTNDGYFTEAYMHHSASMSQYWTARYQERVYSTNAAYILAPNKGVLDIDVYLRHECYYVLLCTAYWWVISCILWQIRLSTLRPGANDLLNDALRLDNELSALAATCSLRSVSKVQINHLGLQNPL